MLELKHISKQFQDRMILDDISICFPTTGFIGIQGTSGCGKSTLLYIIGLIEHEYEGCLVYDGQKIDHHLSFIHQHISYMMQNKDVIDSLTVKENIILACLVSGKKYTQTQLKKITSQLGIEHLLSQYPSQLSGGQFKRVSIAKALLKEANIILCDEPTGALHYQQAREVMEILKQVSLEALVIIVSHDPQLLKAYCDDVLTLENGKLSALKIEPKKQSIHINKKHHHYSLCFYSLRQILFQRYKLFILFIFQWIVILAFFMIVTAMNGVFDAIDESEHGSVLSHVMTIEKKNGEPFSELVSHPLIKTVSYHYALERFHITAQNQELKCEVQFLPQSTSHIILKSGRFPTSPHEVIVSDTLYRSLPKQADIHFQYLDYQVNMKVVGVLNDSFFSQKEIYCHPQFQEDIPFLKDQNVLRVESQLSENWNLYQLLLKEYLVYSDVIERVENYQSLLSIAKGIAGVFVGISFVISLLLIGIVESTIYTERQHDIAYLLSLGIEKRRLFFLSLGEAIFIGGMIALGGCFLSAIAFYYLNEVYEIKLYLSFGLRLHRMFFCQWDLYIVIFISYLVMSIVGILVPMKRMMKTNCIEVLREE